jgi:hypothetical protein
MARNGRVKEKEEEILVVVKTNAIVNPRTMVIHFKNAHAAYPAVVAPVWLILMAPLAMTPVSSAFFFQWIDGVWRLFVPTVIDPFRVVWDTSRVHMYTANVAEDEKQGDTVKHYSLPPTSVRCVMVSHRWRHIELQQPEQVAEHIAGVESEYDATNEKHWKPFCGLCEA